MVEDALTSHSDVKFDGNGVNVKTDESMAEVNAAEKEKKVAIRQALEDVDDELGIKHEKKVALIEAGKDTKEKKDASKNSTTVAKPIEQDKKPKEESKPKEEAKPKTDEAKPKADEA